MVASAFLGEESLLTLTRRRRIRLLPTRCRICRLEPHGLLVQPEGVGMRRCSNRLAVSRVCLLVELPKGGGPASACEGRTVYSTSAAFQPACPCCLGRYSPKRYCYIIAPRNPLTPTGPSPTCMSAPPPPPHLHSAVNVLPHQRRVTRYLVIGQFQLFWKECFVRIRRSL